MMLYLYRGLSVLGTPFIMIYLYFRKISGKEDSDRFNERLGHPSVVRPSGRLIWVHAASVGESLSILPLIERLVGENQGLHILVTTGTVTSAQLMRERLPAGAFHQFFPVDHILFVRRFINYWHPDLVLWVESEFWPNMISEVEDQKINMVLINGRVSQKSFAGWRRFNSLIRSLLSSFNLCLGQSDGDVSRLRQMGAKSIKCVGNLKFSGLPLPFDKADFLEITKLIGNRPVWLAASTHAGEEEIAMQVHQRLKCLHADLLTIIVPRNPKRGKKIASQIRRQGINVTLRSSENPISNESEIYVGDTMGEMGLFLRIASIVFIGKSLVPLGGQNPLEAARLNCAIIHGPYMTNFEDILLRLKEADASIQVLNSEDLLSSIKKLLEDTTYCKNIAAAAKAVAANEAGVLDSVVTELKPFIEHLKNKDSSRANP
jgi:3-deoxy-D-manno-octulosonic-acid transferase